MDKHLHDDPSSATAEDGQVLVDGPDGVAVTLTPDAAAETSDRLLHAAALAQGQAIEKQRLIDEQRTRKTG